MDVQNGTWGLYFWTEENGIELVDPDDRDAFRCLSPYCKVFECVSRQNEFLVLRYGSRQFRVKPDLFRIVPAPRFDIGARVSLIKGGRQVNATICEIHWHVVRWLPFYIVEMAGKRLSKRYWDSDLAPAEPRPG